jgi:hypothetical protein
MIINEENSDTPLHLKYTYEKKRFLFCEMEKDIKFLKLKKILNI